MGYSGKPPAAPPRNYLPSPPPPTPRSPQPPHFVLLFCCWVLRIIPVRQQGGIFFFVSRGGKGEGGACTHLLVALVIWPLTTHPFRDGAPFPLLRKTPPSCGRSVPTCRPHIAFSSTSYLISFIFLAVCGHPLSPRIATVFLLYRRNGGGLKDGVFASVGRRIGWAWGPGTR